MIKKLQQQRLEKIAENYFATTKLVRQYQEQYRTDDWLKGYLNTNIERWNEQVQTWKQ